MTPKPKPKQPEIKEDDEFQDFHLEGIREIKLEWGDDQEDPIDASLWIENWDDDSLEDDFSKQLR